MPITVTEDHEALRLTALRWLQTHCPPTEPRSAAESAGAELPTAWEKMAAQGWLGLHVAEEDGGQGYGISELTVVLEELGYANFPGPVLPTVVVAGLLARYGSAAQRAKYLPGLVDGTMPAALAVSGALSVNGSVVRGTLRPVLGLPTASVVLAPLSDGTWVLLDPAEGASTVLPALDATRPLGELQIEHTTISDDQRLTGLSTNDVRDLALVLAAAESAGLARWCLDTASDYAKVRVQFGRPIGQFQAVKHALADMLVEVEQCAAVAWDAANAWSLPADEPNDGERALTARVAGSLTLDAAAHCAKQCIQLLGGIGFTWEHDAHFYLKRAMATRQLLADPDTLANEVAELAIEGTRRTLTAELPAEAEARRTRTARTGATGGGGRRTRTTHRLGRRRFAVAPLAEAVGPGGQCVGSVGH